MKKLTEFKPINLIEYAHPGKIKELLKEEKLAFRDSPDEKWKIHFSKEMESLEVNIGDYGILWFFYCLCLDRKISRKEAAKAIERYPRDVPNGLTPLPYDRPSLAYVGFDIDLGLNDAYLENEGTWVRWKNAKIFPRNQFVAIDVSTDWAAKNYPEIVEAMEYEAIYDYEVGGDNSIGHRLGDKHYDLDWNEIGKESEDPKTCESPDDHKTGCESKNTEADSQSEPADVDGWIEVRLSEGERLEFVTYDSIANDFKAGKARGKWEASQWKYTPDQVLEQMLSKGLEANIYVAVELARELKGGEG